MVHKHDATRLHYDLRLEMDGALASWAVPKGPSYDPKVRRLAVQTEDHPLEYGKFEGRIPEGEYGAGDSIIWDRGVYETVPPGAASAMRNKGHVEFVLTGEKLKGRWHLVRTQGAEGTRAGKPTWILFKAKDEFADEKLDVVGERPESVVSGKRITRGPTPAAVRRGMGTPLHLLIGVWPPMAAGKARRPPAARTHVYEAHGAGPRALAGLSHGRAALQTEEGRDLGAAHPEVIGGLAKLDVVEAALDGELSRDGKRYVAHDVLWLNGEDLRERPFEERREILKDIVPKDPRITLAPLVAEARPPRGYSRVTARRRGSRYVSGSTDDWVEVMATKKRS